MRTGENSRIKKRIGGFYLTLNKQELKDLKKEDIEVDFISNPIFTEGYIYENKKCL